VFDELDALRAHDVKCAAVEWIFDTRQRRCVSVMMCSPKTVMKDDGGISPPIDSFFRISDTLSSYESIAQTKHSLPHPPISQGGAIE
jgi:hypothetical protein